MPITEGASPFGRRNRTSVPLGVSPRPPFPLAAALALCALLPAGLAARAGGEGANAAQLKAAFVMNFVKFVEWPEGPRQPSAPIVITVLGDREFGEALTRAAAGSRPAGRRVSVRLDAGADDARTAHIVFIGRGEERRLAAILRMLEDQPVLTVGDTRGFAEAGVVLNLYTFDQRVRIEVNTTAAARAQLRLSAHLLRIARIVG